MIKVPKWANWIARDENGRLYVFKNKPKNNITRKQWNNTGGLEYKCINDGEGMFPNIKWTDDQPTKICQESDTGTINKPKHYQNKEGKDLFQKWYEQHDLETYRHIMRAIAERYTSRYENKNGLEDLEKGIYTLQRLLEIEQADKESDFERVYKLIETYHGGTNPND